MNVNTVLNGDCLDVMKELPDNSIDTIITDPPYALTNRTPDVKRCIDCKRVLGGNDGSPKVCPRCGGKLSGQRTKQSRGFMGKEWDNGSVAFNPDIWREALRVAKPGATLMAFGGTRTFHRLTCAIEDAGWEIRDCINYLNDGSHQENAFLASLDDEQLTAYMELHRPQDIMFWCYGSGMGLGHNVSKGIDKAKGMEREVVGTKFFGPDGKERTGGRLNGNYESDDYGKYNTIPTITAPASPLAKEFSGYNSRLKPSFEPIILAQKKLDGTYADNAEKWGVSGLWIDGARVGTEQTTTTIKDLSQAHGNQFGKNGITYPKIGEKLNPPGRYPANTITDGSEDVEAEFAKAGVSPSSARPNSVGKIYNDSDNIFALTKPKIRKGGPSDSGTPSRYFQQCPPDPTQHPDAARFKYNAKAPKSERSTKGNNHPTQKPLSLIRYLCKLTRTPSGGIVSDPFAGSGTTALAALAENRDFILIEKELEYVEICKRRIAEYSGETIEEKEIELEDTTAKQMALW